MYWFLILLALAAGCVFWSWWTGRELDDKSLDPERLKLKIEHRKALTQMIGVVFILAGLFKGLIEARENARYSRETARRAQQTLELAESGQITERFTRAIDQLARESATQRVGSIHALERIATDSQRDHWPVMEVLQTFIRERAGTPVPDEMRKADGIPVDVQAALRALGRRRDIWKRAEAERGQVLRLVGVDLFAASLVEADLERADLSGSRLERADLTRARLADADLKGSDLRHACMLGADLRQADLTDADLHGAHLWNANLGLAQGLTSKHLSISFFDQQTTFPGDLQEVARGMLDRDEHLPPHLEGRPDCKRPSHTMKGGAP